jgi:hypothetical protein
MSLPKDTHNTLTEQQRNCPHPNVRVTVMTPPDPKNNNRKMVMSVCDACKASFWRVGKDGEDAIIDGGAGCVECNSKGSDLNMLRGVATAAVVEPTPAVDMSETAKDDYKKLFTGRDTTLIISHDNDPKFQSFPQYSPNFPPKEGEETAAEDSRSLYDASKGRVRKVK